MESNIVKGTEQYVQFATTYVKKKKKKTEGRRGKHLVVYT